MKKNHFWINGYSSEKGAQWAAIFYTLLGSALKQGHNPLEYLTDLLNRLPNTKINDLEQFFPNIWKPKKEEVSDFDLL